MTDADDRQKFREGLIKDLNAAKRDLRRAKAHVKEIEEFIARFDSESTEKGTSDVYVCGR